MADASFKNKSFVLKAAKEAVYEDIPKPKVEDPYDVIVHVAQTGICGSDVHYWLNGTIGPYGLPRPTVLGHESSGVVTEVGSKVTHLKPGDKVAIETGVPCRRCDFCRDGRYHLCSETLFGETPPWTGTLSQYWASTSDFCYKLPENMDLEQGAMVEPLAVAVAIARAADLRPHQTVVVMGCGPIGILCQAVARAWGATKVIGVDVVQARLDIAKNYYGADGVFMPQRAPPGADPMEHSRAMAGEIKRAFGLGYGADVVLEATGVEPCIQMGVFATKPGGVMVQAGIGKASVNFPISHVCMQSLKIVGSIRYQGGCYPAAIDLISSGKVEVKRLVTNRFRFEEAQDAFEVVKKGSPDVFKVMVSGVE